jgi:DnaB-like helicase N terminal domain
VNDDQSPPTFIFAPEIEQALVAACFQKPEWIAIVYRELDPSVHFTDPKVRHILAAIDLAYRELGSTDFASVIQVLREEGRLEACGGAAGVNSVLEEYRYGFSSPEAAEQIIAHYIETLKLYAINRKKDAPERVYRLTGGIATLALNKAKRRDFEPNYLGEARIAGRWYTVGASPSLDGSFLNFRFEPKL